MRWALLVPTFALIAVGTTGCMEDPCKGFEKSADPAAQELMKKGYEVSIEVKDTECELQPNGKWEQDT